MSSTPSDPYKVLGIPRTATTDQVRSAYRALVKVTHPDVDRSPEAAERFRRVHAAYLVLRDPSVRCAHDLRSRPVPPMERSVVRRPPPVPEARSWSFLALHLTGFLFGGLVLAGTLLTVITGVHPWYVLLLTVPGVIILPPAWHGILAYNKRPRDQGRRAS